MVNTRLNIIYHNMKERCCNPKRKSYKDYGGRGVTVCEEWLNPQKVNVGNNAYNCTAGWVSFKKWALENGYSENLTLDRIDNSKGYSPENCRWVSYEVQCNNTRRNRYITYMGKTKTLSQWCKELGLPYNKVNDRLNESHWSVEKAFSKQNFSKKRFVTYQGRTQCLSDWCKELGLNYRTTLSRLNRLKWSVEDAFTKSVTGEDYRRKIALTNNAN